MAKTKRTVKKKTHPEKDSRLAEKFKRLRKRIAKKKASVSSGKRKKKFVGLDLPSTPLTKADREKVAGTRRAGAGRCPFCDEINCFVSEKWWLRSKKVRARRKVCRTCRKNHMTYEVVEPLFLLISKKKAKKVI